MNKTLVYVALAAVAFLVYRHMQQQQVAVMAQLPAGNNPTGGTQQTSPADLFSQGMALLTSIVNGVTNSQQSSKTV